MLKLKRLTISDLTKAVVLDEISKFRPKWSQTRALDYFYYSGIANAKVSVDKFWK